MKHTHQHVLINEIPGGNEIGIEGIRCISDMLLSNKHLESLDLSCNNIGAEEMKELRRGLKNNSFLTALDLRFYAFFIIFPSSLNFSQN